MVGSRLRRDAALCVSVHIVGGTRPCFRHERRHESFDGLGGQLVDASPARRRPARAPRLVRREVQVRDGDHAHAGGVGRADARAPSPRSPRSARRLDAEPAAPPRGRRRAPACRGRPPPTTPPPGRRPRSRPRGTTASISSGFDDEAIPSGHRSASRRTASTAPGISGGSRAVADEHPLDDRVVDLGRRARNAERLAQVARPLGRAHPHHRPRRLGGVRQAEPAHVLLAHLVPHLLGVDDHAVEVEDDGLGSQRLIPAVDVDERRRRRGLPRAARPRRRRGCGRPPRPGRPCSRTSQPAAPASRRGSSSRTSIPTHIAIGGTPRAKCCATRSWSPAEDRHAPRPRLGQQLVQRRRARDRDADERRLERQRDERRDRQPGAPAVHLGDDDRHPGRPAPEQRLLLPHRPPSRRDRPDRRRRSAGRDRADRARSAARAGRR